jgi:hypothetical protein
MSLLHQRTQFLEAERRHLLAARAATVVGIDLDPIRSQPNLLAHRLEHFRHTRGFLRAVGQNNVLGKTARTGTVAGSGHDGLGDTNHARPGDQPFLNGALDGNVRSAGPFRPQIAQQREAGQERRFHVEHRLNGAIGHRLFKDLIVP